MIYLIKRGPRPEYHKAPFHPVIICDNKETAYDQAGWSGDYAWIWTVSFFDGQGWLLLRWNGLDIDYGHIARTFVLPGDTGKRAAIYHDRDKEPWTLIQGAVWWSVKKIPKRLIEAGVIYPSDDFTQQTILDKHAWREQDKQDKITDKKAKERFKETGVPTISMSFRMGGFGREIPDYWPEPIGAHHE